MRQCGYYDLKLIFGAEKMESSSAFWKEAPQRRTEELDVRFQLFSQTTEEIPKEQHVTDELWQPPASRLSRSAPFRTFTQ